MSNTEMPQPCPLCRSDAGVLFYDDARRTYWRCGGCRLVFVPKQFLPTPQAERAHYDLHENDPRDERYRAFLSRLCQPMLKRLRPGSCGLDFGCGPGPTLSIMLEEAGHRVTLYDPFYADHPTVFDCYYDFITASEVVEHLHHPRREWGRLWNRLNPGGVLGVMTKLVRNRDSFRTWHYIRDPTHVCFYSEATFKWLAEWLNAEVARVGDDVVLFLKSG